MADSCRDDDGNVGSTAEATAVGAPTDGAGKPASEVATTGVAEKPDEEKTDDDLLAAIKRLKAEQNEARANRKRIRSELKNAERRRARVRKKAKLLSDNDLVDVLKMRGMTSAALSVTPR